MITQANVDTLIDDLNDCDTFADITIRIKTYTPEQQAGLHEFAVQYLKDERPVVAVGKFYWVIIEATKKEMDQKHMFTKLARISSRQEKNARRRKTILRESAAIGRQAARTPKTPKAIPAYSRMSQRLQTLERQWVVAEQRHQKIEREWQIALRQSNN